jgi:hypothetical protein
LHFYTLDRDHKSQNLFRSQILINLLCVRAIMARKDCHIT